MIVTVGVDTHTDVHVAAVLDQAGRLLGTGSFPATTRGYAQLATWAESFGTVDKVGMEGTGHFGAGLLREHHRQQAEERLAAGSAWTDSGGLVFTNRWGEPLYPDTVSALMNKLISKHNDAGASPAQALPHARLHDLRHLHATTLLLAGVPVHVVAARLGHADPAVTLRIYSHVLREHTLGVGDVFAQAVKCQVPVPGRQVSSGS
jgi:hypothetical protein